MALPTARVLEPPSEAAGGAEARPRRRMPVNRRSVALGLLGVVLICAFAPYNDWVLNNTLLIGSYLPVGVVLLLLALIALVNAPLQRWWPRQALNTGELAVVLGMVLVGCAVPSSGLLRYLPAGLVSSYHQAQSNPDFRRVLEEANVPQWLLPQFQGTTVAERMNDPVVNQFVGRAHAESDTFAARWHATPWGAWTRPMLTWGLFVAAFWGAILCGSVIVHRQWAQNERLPFPLASIYVSLIEPPEQGRVFNPLLRSRTFWCAFLAVLFVHLLQGLHLYDSKHWPQIPLAFDFRTILANPPWSYAEEHLKMATLYLSISAITFFVQTKVSFSLWFLFVLYHVVLMVCGTWQTEFTYGAQTDQQVGALVPYAAAMLWVGRHHWAAVARQMLGRRRRHDPEGRYLPYALAGWGLVLCVATMVAWLTLAGMTVGGAVVLALSLLLMMMVLARAVAETGLLYMAVNLPFQRVWIYAANELPAFLTFRTSFTNHFFSTWMNQLFGHDPREALPPYSTQALRTADQAGLDPDANADRAPRRQAWMLIVALVLSLAVAYGVSWVSNLYVEYAHAVSRDRSQTAPINPWAVDGSIRWVQMGPSVDYLPPRTGPTESHTRLGHFAAGAGIAAAFSFLRLRFAWWPLHPLGYLLAYTWLMKIIWFSIFVGWLGKVLVVRFGDIGLFRAARSLCIGVIIGEAAASGLWLLVSVLFSALGWSYYSVPVLPP